MIPTNYRWFQPGRQSGPASCTHLPQMSGRHPGPELLAQKHGWGRQINRPLPFLNTHDISTRCKSVLPRIHEIAHYFCELRTHLLYIICLHPTPHTHVQNLADNITVNKNTPFLHCHGMLYTYESIVCARVHSVFMKKSICYVPII